MTDVKTFPTDLAYLEEYLFGPAGFVLANVAREGESKEYAAHTFTLGNLKILFRLAKITPTKTGQFVTLWKRNAVGITTPFTLSDKYDFYLVAARKETQYGLFIFPKMILYRHGTLASEKKNGKLGMRVYPAWDKPMNSRAQRTQSWQTEYFINIKEGADLQKAKDILNGEFV